MAVSLLRSLKLDAGVDSKEQVAGGHYTNKQMPGVNRVEDVVDVDDIASDKGWRVGKYKQS